MNPCALDGTDQRARTVLAACVEPDGPVDAETYVNASKSNQLPRNGLMSGSRKAVWKESVRRGRDEA